MTDDDDLNILLIALSHRWCFLLNNKETLQQRMIAND